MRLGGCASYDQLTHRWRTGDIVSVSLFGKNMVILNSLEAANELLDKKGAIYAARPVLPVSGNIMKCDRFMVFQQYGSDLKDMRRLVFQSVGTHNSLMRLTGALEDLVKEFIRRVATDPSSLSRHVKRYAGLALYPMSIDVRV